MLPYHILRSTPTRPCTPRWRGRWAVIGGELVTWLQWSPLIGPGGQLQPGAGRHGEPRPHPHLLLHREPQRVADSDKFGRRRFMAFCFGCKVVASASAANGDRRQEAAPSPSRPQPTWGSWGGAQSWCRVEHFRGSGDTGWGELVMSGGYGRQSEDEVQGAAVSSAQNWYSKVTKPGFHRKSVDRYVFKRGRLTAPSWSGRTLSSLAAAWCITEARKTYIAKYHRDI